MSEVAVDFGTSNTVLARYNEATGRAETVEIPGITSEVRYRLTPDGSEHVVWVVPSMIHYSDSETLIGDQVLSRGLAEHPHTIRWMKRAIAQGVTKRRKTAQGHIGPQQAGEDFLRTLLNYASDRLSLEDDSFTFTAPVEAFENFQDWLFRLCESASIRRVRWLDEPTACVFGYQGAARRDERFVVFDFGGGTLDVSAVRIDLTSSDDKKAVVLGQAGCDLGGMDIDQWLAADFCQRHRLDEYERRELEALIVRQAEAVKITLSDPTEESAEMTVLNQVSRPPRLLQTTYSRSCTECQRGQVGRHSSANEGCFGCLLLANNFMQHVRETVERALENAAVKSGMRRSDVIRLLVTGGTSLVPAVRRLLDEVFGSRVEYDHPFDCVVRGACRGLVVPILQHDYAIENYNRERREYEFKPLFRIGTEYPTPADKPVRFWSNGAFDGATRIGLKIFEVSRMRRRTVDAAIVDAAGVLRDESRVATEYEYICLNSANPTFIIADPPVNIERDKRRFLSCFTIDGNRRLLVTVVDNLTGKTLLKEHPVVRL